MHNANISWVGSVMLGNNRPRSLMPVMLGKDRPRSLVQVSIAYINSGKFIGCCCLSDTRSGEIFGTAFSNKTIANL